MTKILSSKLAETIEAIEIPEIHSPIEDDEDDHIYENNDSNQNNSVQHRLQPVNLEVEASTKKFRTYQQTGLPTPPPIPEQSLDTTAPVDLYQMEDNFDPVASPDDYPNPLLNSTRRDKRHRDADDSGEGDNTGHNDKKRRRVYLSSVKKLSESRGTAVAMAALDKALNCSKRKMHR